MLRMTRENRRKYSGLVWPKMTRMFGQPDGALLEIVPQAHHDLPGEVVSQDVQAPVAEDLEGKGETGQGGPFGGDGRSRVRGHHG